MLVAVRKDIREIADRLEPELRESFLRAVEAARGSVDVERLSSLLEMGDVDGVLRLLEVSPPPGDVARILREAAQAAARDTGFALSFSVVNVEAARWAEDRAADLVTLVDDGIRDAIRDVIVRGQLDGLNVRDQAQELRMLVGLTERHARAVDRLFRGFEDPEFGRRQSQRYADRLLRFRAEMIARTETQRAANMGTQIGWDRAAADGLLDADARKIWIVTDDDRLCPQCAPMDGKTVEVAGEFVSDSEATSFDGDQVREVRPASEVTAVTPPLHPQCRCTMGLEGA